MNQTFFVVLFSAKRARPLNHPYRLHQVGRAKRGIFPRVYRPWQSLLSRSYHARPHCAEEALPSPRYMLPSTGRHSRRAAETEQHHCVCFFASEFLPSPRLLLIVERRSVERERNVKQGSEQGAEHICKRKKEKKTYSSHVIVTRNWITLWAHSCSLVCLLSRVT